MALRKYSRFDLLRFKKFADENKDVAPMQLLRDYDVKYPELSAKQQLENLYAALDMNEEYKNLTGHDIPESARWQIDSDEPEANANIPHVSFSEAEFCDCIAPVENVDKGWFKCTKCGHEWHEQN